MTPLEKKWEKFCKARKAYVLLGIFGPMCANALGRLMFPDRPTSITSVLMLMERYGFMTYEDDDGLLYRYKVVI